MQSPSQLRPSLNDLLVETIPDRPAPTAELRPWHPSTYAIAALLGAIPAAVIALMNVRWLGATRETLRSILLTTLLTLIGTILIGFIMARHATNNLNLHAFIGFAIGRYAFVLLGPARIIRGQRTLLRRYSFFKMGGWRRIHLLPDIWFLVPLVLLGIAQFCAEWEAVAVLYKLGIWR